MLQAPYFFPSKVKRSLGVFLLLKLLKQCAFHYCGWAKTATLMDFGCSVDVNLALDLVRHYSGRSVDVNLERNLGGYHSCDVISSPNLEYFLVNWLVIDVLLTSHVEQYLHVLPYLFT